MTSALYNLNKDLAHIEYLQQQLKELRIQYALSFDHMNDNNTNTWVEFKSKLLNYQYLWRNSDIKRAPYIHNFKRVKIEDISIQNSMELELEYFDAKVQYNDNGSVSFEAPECYTPGLDAYLNRLQSEFGNEFVNIKSKDMSMPISKVFVLFLLGINELDKYSNMIHFEWLFDEFKCTVPISYLYDRSLLLLERVVQKLE